MKLSKQLVLYLVFGGLTTLVNILAFYFLTLLSLSTALATILSWFASVLFAFFTNKIYVFESKNRDFMAELISFFGCRAFSGAFDLGVMLLFVDVLDFPSMIIKILSNIVVIIMNYFLSKLLVFKK